MARLATGAGRAGWHDGAMLIAFSVIPFGVGEAVGDPVAEAVRLVRVEDRLAGS